MTYFAFLGNINSFSDCTFFFMHSKNSEGDKRDKERELDTERDF